MPNAVWTARALTERAFTYLALGATRRAAADLAHADQLFRASGQELESVDATVHQGILALRAGDVPGALKRFDEAADRFQALDTVEPDLSLHRCSALLTAGLPNEALAE